MAIEQLKERIEKSKKIRQNEASLAEKKSNVEMIAPKTRAFLRFSIFIFKSVLEFLQMILFSLPVTSVVQDKELQEDFMKD